MTRIKTGIHTEGAIKSLGSDGTYRYAIVTKDVPYGSSLVSTLQDEKKIKKCKEIGTKVHKAIPIVEFNGRKTKPVMTRVDVVCCLDNKSINSLDYYLNEIEEGGLAGSYTDFTQITYPFVEMMAEAYVRKATELLK